MPPAAGPRAKDEDSKRRKELAKQAAQDARAKAAAEKKAEREQEAHQRLTRKLLATATKHMQPVDNMLKRLAKAFADAENYMEPKKIAASLHHGVCKEAEQRIKVFLEQSQVLIRKAAEGAVVRDESALDMDALSHFRAAGPALRGLLAEIEEARPARPKRTRKSQSEAAGEVAAEPPAESAEALATQRYD